MARYDLRITRFDDQRSFRRVSEFLTALYPERDPLDFESALARLPCIISHDAEESAARELDRALSIRGARTRLTCLGGDVDDSLSDDSATSQEVELSFLETGGKRPSPGPRRKSDGAGSPPKKSRSRIPFLQSGSPAPWEEE